MGAPAALPAAFVLEALALLVGFLDIGVGDGVGIGATARLAGLAVGPLVGLFAVDLAAVLAGLPGHRTRAGLHVGAQGFRWSPRACVHLLVRIGGRQTMRLLPVLGASLF